MPPLLSSVLFVYMYFLLIVLSVLCLCITRLCFTLNMTVSSFAWSSSCRLVWLIVVFGPSSQSSVPVFLYLLFLCTLLLLGFFLAAFIFLSWMFSVLSFFLKSVLLLIFYEILGLPIVSSFGVWMPLTLKLPREIVLISSFCAFTFFFCLDWSSCACLCFLCLCLMACLNLCLFLDWLCWSSSRRLWSVSLLLYLNTIHHPYLLF